MNSISPLELAKKVAGESAAALIQDGMRVGLGTGSTAAHFIIALGKRCAMGLKIQAVATSIQSSQLAAKVGIPLSSDRDLHQFDITVDGADEIDPHFNMIKGGGGALLREKLLALASNEVIIIADSTKWVPYLGRCKIPIEVVPFLYPSTLRKLREMGHQGDLRYNSDASLFITDNGNYIFDIHTTSPLYDPATLHLQLKSVTGVVETGLFFQLVKRVIVGYESGKIEILTRK